MPSVSITLTRTDGCLALLFSPGEQCAGTLAGGHLPSTYTCSALLLSCQVLSTQADAYYAGYQFHHLPAVLHMPAKNARCIECALHRMRAAGVSFIPNERRMNVYTHLLSQRRRLHHYC